MKVRDSGMPEEERWNDFFNVELILSELHLDSTVREVVEVGCGYGTFTIPVAKTIHGSLFAFDIEKEMLDVVACKLAQLKIANVKLVHRDILTQTTGLAENSIDYVLLFNILHHDAPIDFLNEAWRILKPGGKVGIIHWRSDIETPRGPDLSIRPKPEQVLAWMDSDMFELDVAPKIFEPYHYGIVFSKTTKRLKQSS